MLHTEEAAELLLEAAAVCTVAVPLLQAAEGCTAAVPFMREEAASMWVAAVMPEDEFTWAAPVIMTVDTTPGELFTVAGECMLAAEAFTAEVPLSRVAEAALLEGGVTLDALVGFGAGRPAAS